MGRTRLAKASVAELRNGISKAKNRLKKLENYQSEINKQFLHRAISGEDYNQIIRKDLGGGNLKSYIHSYGKYIHDSERIIKEHKKEILKSRIRTGFFSFLFVGIFLAVIFSTPTFIGFFTQEPSQDFVDNINLNFSESSDYNWTPQNQGNLDYFKISGLHKGNGNVKIYLDDFLVYDSSSVINSSTTSSSTSLLTGNVINEPKQQLSFFKKFFAFTGLVIEEENSSQIIESFSSITEEEVSQNASPSQDSNETPLLDENQTQEETIEPVNETTEPPGVLEEIPEELFELNLKEVCKDTCNLRDYNLNKSSYNIRIELSDSTFTLKNISYGIIPMPIEEVNITELNITNISLIQGEAILGKPVKWFKRIQLETPGEVITEIPENAENIIVNQINEEEQKSEAKHSITKKTKSTKDTSSRITGNAIEEEPLIQEITINENSSEYEVVYETPAAYAIEKDILRGKRVKVVGPEDIHYQNVLSFANLSETLNVKNPSAVKIYWVENQTYLPVTSVQDRDNNSIYDYVEWIAPSLSNQTFEIIVITKAEHLDKDRIFISDIYEQVKTLDDVWSEAISNHEYVRVTFEQNLTSSKDITIFPRKVSGNPRIEVYEKDENESIAEFTTITDNEYNKVYLTALEGIQDTFDLKIVGGSVQFDYIVDPSLTSVGGTFFDGFESGSINTTWWTGNVGWATSTLNAQYGTYHLRSAGADQDNINLSVDTTDYSNINITYYVYAYNKKSVSLTISYWNGTGWTIIDAVTGSNNQLRKTFILPSSADNNPNAKLRWTCGGGHVLDVCAIDNVTVFGLGDTNIPQFTNYGGTQNNTPYTFGGSYVFNTTITYTNGTAWLQFNGANYSATNTSSLYTVTLSSVSAGNYNYIWWARGNGTANNLNNSQTPRTYGIAKATLTASLANDQNWDRVYDGTANNISYTESNAGDGGVVYKVYQNGTDKGAYDLKSVAGTYAYVLNSTGGQNYSASASLASNTLSITKDTTASCGVVFNETSVTYPAAFKVWSNCTSGIVLYRNGNVIENNSNQALAASTYNFTVIRNDTVNYTNIYEERNFVVSKATPALGISGSTPIIYGTTSGFTGTNCPTQLSPCDLSPSNQIYGVGTITFNYSTPGNTNYTANWTLKDLVVNVNAESFNIFTNTSSPVTYPTAFTVYSNSTSVFTLYRNGTTITNASIQGLATGTYNFTIIRTDQVNYSNVINTTTFRVNQNSEKVYTLFNETSSVTYPNAFTVYSNATLGFTIYKNGSSVGNNSDQGLAAGTYNFTTIRTDNVNYSDVYDEQTFQVNKASGDCGVVFNETSSVTYPAAFKVWSNCTSGIVLYRNGSVIENNSDQALAANTYNFTVIRNDTVNYTNIYGERNFVVGKATPIGSLASTKGWGFSYDGTATNVSYSESNTGDGGVVYKVYQNGTDKGPYDLKSSAGTYGYVLNTTGGTNYSASASMNAQTLSITKDIISSCGVVFNRTSPVELGNPFQVWHNCTTIATLYRNDTEIENDSTQNLAISTYNFTVIRLDQTNYSQIYDERNFEVIPNPPPVLNAKVTSPATIYTNTDIILNATCWNAEDTIKAWSRVWLNTGGGYFQDETDSSFVIPNATNTQIYNYTSGNYSKGNAITFEVWCDDTVDNSTHENTTQIVVQDTAPTVPTSANLNTTSLGTNEVVLCTADGSTDADEDSFTYWYKFNESSGALQDWTTSDTFDCTTAGCDLGDTVTCWALASTTDANSSVYQGQSFTVINYAPTIDIVWNTTMTDISSSGTNEAPVPTYVHINFTASDEDTYEDLDDTSAVINFSRGGEETRTNASCARYGGSGNSANYTCNVTMWWWDGAGDWDIQAYIKDLSGEAVTNTSANFYIGATSGVIASPSALDFAEIVLGLTNQLAINNPMLLNNTGNTVKNIQVNATDLVGETDPGKALYAENFSVNTENQCEGTGMSENVFIQVGGASLLKGNYTKSDGTGQEQIYFCLEASNSDLSPQYYSTAARGSWTVRIFAVLLFSRRRKKNKKGETVEEDVLFKTLIYIKCELKKESSLQRIELLDLITRELCEMYSLAEKNIFELVEPRERITIPLSIFSSSLGALEAIVKYMKENLNMSYHEIGELLGRNERTIWTAYNKSREKLEESFKVKQDEEVLPISTFNFRELTILEALVFYLKQKGMKYVEISDVVSRDQRNVWTIYSNAKSKVGRKRIERELKKKEKKTKQPDKNILVKALREISLEIKTSPSQKRLEIIRLLSRETSTEYKITERELKEELRTGKEITIPLSIFSSSLGALEAITKYMKENLNMSYHEIGELIGRDERTIWTAYSKSKEKLEKPFKIGDKDRTINLSAFNLKKLTILEALIFYLKQKGLKYVEISEVVSRDQRNIWTIYNNAKSKLH